MNGRKEITLSQTAVLAPATLTSSKLHYQNSEPLAVFDTPILLIIFNRPGKARQVFDEIRKQRPRELFIAADGPRTDRPDEQELCKKSREILNDIDWECNVKTLLRDKNLGCGAGPAQAIDWFFEHVEQGIILEDDILPDPSFFPFCASLLERYKDDKQIMHISGCYFLESLLNREQSPGYYFTRHIHVWGWATWRRAWQSYDYDMEEWRLPGSKKALKTYYGDYAIFWKDIFENMLHKGNDIWDYQWMFAIYRQNGLAINPTKNLTRNIGFGADATHTRDTGSIFTTVKINALTILQHPGSITVNDDNDALYYKHFLNFDLDLELAKRTPIWKLKRFLRNLKRRLHS